MISHYCFVLLNAIFGKASDISRNAMSNKQEIVSQNIIYVQPLVVK